MNGVELSTKSIASSTLSNYAIVERRIYTVVCFLSVMFEKPTSPCAYFSCSSVWLLLPDHAIQQEVHGSEARWNSHQGWLISERNMTMLWVSCIDWTDLLILCIKTQAITNLETATGRGYISDCVGCNIKDGRKAHYYGSCTSYTTISQGGLCLWACGLERPDEFNFLTIPRAGASGALLIASIVFLQSTFAPDNSALVFLLSRCGLCGLIRVAGVIGLRRVFVDVCASSQWFKNGTFACWMKRIVCALSSGATGNECDVVSWGLTIASGCLLTSVAPALLSAILVVVVLLVIVVAIVGDLLGRFFFVCKSGVGGGLGGVARLTFVVLKSVNLRCRKLGWDCFRRLGAVPSGSPSTWRALPRVWRADRVWIVMFGLIIDSNRRRSESQLAHRLWCDVKLLDLGRLGNGPD